MNTWTDFVYNKEISFLDNLTTLKLTDHERGEVVKMYERLSDEEAAFGFGGQLSDIRQGKMPRPFNFCHPFKLLKVRGVYKIEFGEGTGKFYIGSAKYLKDRLKNHESEIRKYFHTGRCLDNHYFKKVFEYLAVDLFAYLFPVTILKECESVLELAEAEQSFLDQNKDNPDCLNLNFKAIRPTHTIDETVEEHRARKWNQHPYHHKKKK